MAQSLATESNPRRQNSFKNKSGERSSPVPPKGTRLDENEENMDDLKVSQGRMSPSSSPRARAASGSKDLAHSVHSGLSARMLELSKPKGEVVPKRPKSPLAKRGSPLVDKKPKQAKSLAVPERSTSPRQPRTFKESPTMKLRKSSTEAVNPKPILKKSTSAVNNAAQPPHVSATRRRSNDQPFSGVEFGRSVQDTFRIKKKKKKAESDTYGTVDFDNALNSSEPRRSRYHKSKSLKPLGGKLGLGHNFQLISLTNPSWCDHCGDFIWGLNKQCIKCSSEW